MLSWSPSKRQFRYDLTMTISFTSVYQPSRPSWLMTPSLASENYWSWQEIPRFSINDKLFKKMNYSGKASEIWSSPLPAQCTILNWVDWTLAKHIINRWADSLLLADHAIAVQRMSAILRFTELMLRLKIVKINLVRKHRLKT